MSADFQRALTQQILRTELIRIKRSDFRLAHVDSNQVRAGAAFIHSGFHIAFVWCLVYDI